ncbi:MAG: DUF3782 domain-containing protein [Pseudomonadota bacterium]
MLDELRRDREEQTRKWEEQMLQDRLFREEQARKWEEQKQQDKLFQEEQARKWDESGRRFDAIHQQIRTLTEEQARKWDESGKRFDAIHQQIRALTEEQARKWDESGQRFDALHQEIMEQAKKYDRGIGALGSRWGTQSEKAFRDALAAILEKSFGVQVINVNEYDDAGEVFGQPDQVELDVIVKNGLMIICELKSSIDKAGMYIFERKARFYEKRHQRQANRLIVISPMIDARARKVGEKLGIEMYGDSLEVSEL